MPIGNGALGAMVFGGVTSEQLQFNEKSLWTGGPGASGYNFGNWTDDKFDQLAAQSSEEADPKKREELIKAALREFRSQVHLIPLHRQMIPWATRANVTVVHRPDNWFELRWASVAGK